MTETFKLDQSKETYRCFPDRKLLEFVCQHSEDEHDRLHNDVRKGSDNSKGGFLIRA